MLFVMLGRIMDVGLHIQKGKGELIVDWRGWIGIQASEIVCGGRSMLNNLYDEYEEILTQEEFT